jgi:hypothetical protein
VNGLSSNKTMVGVLVAIIALIVSGIFCVYMFIVVGNTQNKARDTDRAVLAAQSAVEKFKSGVEIEPLIYYDRYFTKIDEYDEEGFTLTVDIQHNNGLVEITVEVTKNKPYLLRGPESSYLFTLETAVYRIP